MPTRTLGWDETGLPVLACHKLLLRGYTRVLGLAACCNVRTAAGGAELLLILMSQLDLELAGCRHGNPVRNLESSNLFQVVIYQQFVQQYARLASLSGDFSCRQVFPCIDDHSLVVNATRFNADEAIAAAGAYRNQKLLWNGFAIKAMCDFLGHGLIRTVFIPLHSRGIKARR